MSNSGANRVCYIPLSYDPDRSEESAIQLIQALDPLRVDTQTTLVRFTDGLTNTLLKAETRRNGQTQQEIDRDAILLRAYGPGTDVLIDRKREVRAHTLLAERGLAPPLLARFENGLIYSFIAGTVCTPEDIRQPRIYKSVAAKLGQWHGTLSLDTICDHPSTDHDTKAHVRRPNVWTVTQSWLQALPRASPDDHLRQKSLQKEFDWLTQHLGHTPGLLGNDFVFGHCDLLSGNVIATHSHGDKPDGLPATNGNHVAREATDSDDTTSSPVAFIDYEYATAAPAAFDIANHFSEWGGFECDYTVLPTRSQRAEFLSVYVHALYRHSGHLTPSEQDRQAAERQLSEQVDLYRGVPGFYWGVWSLIQAQTSCIDFDYASYAEIRLQEYHDWKASLDASATASHGSKSVREQRWAEL